MNFLLGAASFIFQLKRLNSYIQKKNKTKRTKRDYQNVIDNFIEGIVIYSKSGNLLYIIHYLKQLLREDIQNSSEFDDENTWCETIDKKLLKIYDLKRQPAFFIKEIDLREKVSFREVMTLPEEIYQLETFSDMKYYDL